MKKLFNYIKSLVFGASSGNSLRSTQGNENPNGDNKKVDVLEDVSKL